MKNIIIFGPPGAGKGTQSAKIIEEFELRHISTGDIIRSNQERGTKIGKIADKIVDEGNLLPDNVVNEMIKQEIIDDTKSTGFIFDGFPRTTGQAKMLDEFMHSRKTPIDLVLYLDLEKHRACERIIGRGKTSGRKDDTKEAFPTRWTAYQSSTLPIIKYFDGRSKVVKIDADQTIDEVFEAIKKAIGTKEDDSSRDSNK